MKTICFFSSDATPLYKKGIYDLMALPEGYIIQYRYEKAIVSIDLSNPEKYLGKECYMFFTSGNDLKKNADQRKLNHTILRKATIRFIEFTNDTNLYHFFLELKGFIKEKDATDYTKILQEHKNILPLNKFLAEIDLEIINTDWLNRVDAIKSEFLGDLFFSLSFSKRIDENSNQILNPSFHINEKQTQYILEDETEYLINISFFDTSFNELELHTMKSQFLDIRSSNEALAVNMPQVIGVGAKKDNNTIKIFTNSLSTRNTNSFLHFKTLSTSGSKSNNERHEENDILIQFKINKNRRHSYLFAFYSVLAAIAVGYGKIVADKYDLNGDFDTNLFLHTIFVLIVGYVSVYNLYRLFNKK